MFAIVMAGGVGTRLWPLSRRRSPKQLLALTGDTSLLQQTVARLNSLLKPHDIYVITSQAHVRATQEQLPQLPEDNVLGEPLARSTGVAAGLATVLARRESDEVALVLPADHFLADEGAFTAAIRQAITAAERGYLVTLGVVRNTPPPATATSRLASACTRPSPPPWLSASSRSPMQSRPSLSCRRATTSGTPASSSGASTPSARRWSASSRSWRRRSMASPLSTARLAG